MTRVWTAEKDPLGISRLAPEKCRAPLTKTERHHSSPPDSPHHRSLVLEILQASSTVPPTAVVRMVFTQGALCR